MEAGSQLTVSSRPGSVLPSLSWTFCTYTLMVPAGVSSRYWVETPAGTINVYVQNVQESDGSTEPGRSLTVSWDPGSTFVLEPMEGRTE